MSLVDEVEKAIEEATAVCNAEDGVCHASHIGGGTIRLMAEHGPAILAAVKLAEARVRYLGAITVGEAGRFAVEVENATTEYRAATGAHDAE